MGDLRLSETDGFDWDGTRDRIVEMAGRGLPQTYIAKAVGCNVKTVARILKSEYADRNSNKQKIVEAHSQTVNWLKLKITERIHSAGNLWQRQDGELLLKVLERESKLFGIDQPTQSQVNVVIEDYSDEELIKQLAAEGFVFQQLPPPQAPLSLPEPIEDAVIHERPKDATAEAEVGPDTCGQ